MMYGHGESIILKPLKLECWPIRMCSFICWCKINDIAPSKPSSLSPTLWFFVVLVFFKILIAFHGQLLGAFAPLWSSKLLLIVASYRPWSNKELLPIVALYVVWLLLFMTFFLVSWFCSWYSWSFYGFVVGRGFTFINHDLFYGLPILVHVFLHYVNHDFLSHLPIIIHDLANVDHGFLSYLVIVIRDLANVDCDFLLSSCIC